MKPPRVAEAPAALECKWVKTVPLEPLEGGPARYLLVIGQVVGVHIDDRFIVDGIVDTGAMLPIMRAGYHDYFTALPEGSSRCGARRDKGAATSSGVDEDVDEATERVANVEAADAPRLARRAVLDRQPCIDDAAVDLVEIVDLDREIGHRRADPPSVATLIWGAHDSSPAKSGSSRDP